MAELAWGFVLAGNRKRTRSVRYFSARVAYEGNRKRRIERTTREKEVVL